MRTSIAQAQRILGAALFVLLVTALAGCGGASGLEAVAGKFRLGGKLVAQSVTVGATHVYAVSSESGQVDRVLAPLDADGRFTIDLPLGRSYALGVLDASRTGVATVRGYLEFEGVHTLPIEIEGVFDLGAVSQTDGSRWSSELAGTGGLLTQLGLSTATIASLAAQDGLALRYLNGDVDNNGVLDVSEADKNFIAEVDVFYEARSVGTTIATVDDIRGGAIPAFESFAFDTTRTSAMTSSFGYFSSAVSETSATVRYIDAEGVVTSILPDGAPQLDSDTDGTFSAGTWSGSSAYQAVEIGLLATSELPRGEIRVDFDASGTLLSFFPMLGQLAADLKQGYEHAFAFIALNEDAGAGACASAPCRFSSLSFQWKIVTASGIRNATSGDLRALVSSRGAKYRFDANGEEVDISIPSNAVEGTIAWDAANANLGGLPEDDFGDLTRDMLCGNRVEHVDRFGLKYSYRIGPAALATGCTN